MNTQLCACGCGRELPVVETQRRRRQFYDASCRQRAHRASLQAVIPDKNVTGSNSVTGHVKPILKYPGSKWSLASWITSHFPDHRRYVEPYCGSAACFFAKEPAKHEVLNDLNGSIVNFFRVLRSRPADLAGAIALTPWSEEEYNAIEKSVVVDDPLEHARRFLVRSWQAHGGTINQVSGWKHNGLNGNVFPSHLWQKIPERLLMAADRLKDAEIRNRPALEIIRYYNSVDTLLYVDPPYMLSTRSRKYYSHEMTDGDHAELLEALDRHTGMVVLSGYAHALYDDRLSHWQRVSMLTNGEHGKHQTEVLWLNQRVPATVQRSLFGEEENIA